MKKLIVTALFFSLLSCGKKGGDKNEEDKIAPTVSQEKGSSSSVDITNPSDGKLRIASFNIQVLGDSKVSKVPAMNVINKIINKFDIILIQELRDEDRTGIANFMDIINEECHCYNYVSSDRLGRSSSKEQYVLVFKTKLVNKIDKLLFKDDKDYFEREPFAVNLTLFNGEQLAFANVHIKPEDANNEIKRLPETISYFANSFGHDKIILGGDFNADCSYLKAEQKSSLEIFNLPFISPITQDTTIAKSRCSYDKLIFKDSLSAKVSNVGPFYYDTFFDVSADVVTLVSDHYPISLDFQLEP